MSKLDKLVSSRVPLSKKEEIAKVDLAMENRSNEAYYKKIPVHEIVFNPDNDYSKNDTLEEIQSLADDIYRNSLLHNIVVLKKENSFMLISGERRVRAYLLLKEDVARNSRGEYDYIQAKVYQNLTQRQTMLMLDSANLQTRSSGNESVFRNSLNRYINNLKEEFDISEQAALVLAKRAAGASDRTVENARLLQVRLIEELTELIDIGVLPKRWAMTLFDLSKDEQLLVSRILHLVASFEYQDVHKKESVLRSTIKSIVAVVEYPAMQRLDALEKIYSEKLRADEADVLKAPNKVYNGRHSFIQHFEEIQEKVKKLNTKKKLEAIVSFDVLNPDERIADCLDQTIETMKVLKGKLEQLTDYNYMLNSGQDKQGRKLTHEELKRIKELKRELLNEK